MKAWSRFAVVTIAGCLSALIAGTAAKAAEITLVTSAGPLPDVMGTLVPMFESATGNKVKVSTKAGPAIIADLKQGAVDIAISAREVVDDRAKSGDVAAIDITFLMISTVGIA